MARTLVLFALTSLILGGCANGWPTARHPLRSTATAKNCVPTSSKIDRADCENPGGTVTGTDLERGGQVPRATGHIATFGKP